MILQKLPRNAVISVVNNKFHTGTFPKAAAQGALRVGVASEEFVSKLLDRRWVLSRPDTKINQIIISEKDNRGSGDVLGSASFVNNPKPSLGDDMKEKDLLQPSFYIVRDDLLHPLVNGNKARKLDALLPLLEDFSVTDVVTCGGCQSAHAAAVAVSCAERGLKSRLLLRGEQPLTLTGYDLISTLYGNVTYVPRSLYARREDMLLRHAALLAGNTGLVLQLDDLLADCFKNNARQNSFHVDGVQNIKKVAIINEGAGDSVALLGVIRLVHYLAQDHLFGKERAVKIIIDAGTGTTAVGVALGALLLGLPWEVTAVMLADTIDGYKKKEESLVSEFCASCTYSLGDQLLNRMNDGIVQWVDRRCPRKFGNILEREIQECQKIAQQTGVSVDPVYTLAAWELATSLCQDDAGDAQVVMLHTGGTLGMFGLAQRYRSYFQKLDDGISN